MVQSSGKAGFISSAGHEIAVFPKLVLAVLEEEISCCFLTQR